MHNQYAKETLGRILNQNGMEELQQLIDEWKVVAQNLSKLPQTTHVLLPNCLFATRSGVGITMLLGLIAQFLEDEKLIEFVGEVKYFEFVLDRSENVESFPAFTRLEETFRIAAGFRGFYKGISCIDISEWIDDLHDVRFTRFLEYVSDLSQHVLFIFLIPFDEKRVGEVEAALIPFLRVRRLKVDFPDSEEFSMYVDARLKSHGFILEDQARAMLKKTIAHARVLLRFDGYNALNQLVEDIIYEKCSHKLMNDNVVTVADLHLFSPEGHWINQLRCNISQRNLGFQIDCR